MPGSDRPPRYWLALLLTLGAVAAMVAVNVVVNPVGTFGPPRRHVFDRATPQSVMYYLGETRRTRFYDAVVADPGADLLLIGTSRTDVGFDTCGLPIRRVVGYGWGIREFGRLARVALARRTRRATLLIELPVDDDPPLPPVAGTAGLIHDALSPKVTRLSWDTLMANLRPRPVATGINCRRPGRYVEPARRFGAGRNGLAEALPTLGSPGYRRGLTRLAGVLAGLDRICATRRIAHRVVFFRLPPSYVSTPALVRLLQASSRDVRQAIARRPQGECAVTFVDAAVSPPGDVAVRARWRDPVLWFNESHFSPRLGNPALVSLLTRGAARSVDEGR